ncbi:hypothetical protein PLICRDRAFT_484241 [Plicaturopsis crispa FD-325 SS-3]|nr:hypothetical protein PLICRDRAFT_484241 [Plicaturopsis crispa FD-325 SS-3]
MSTAQNAGIADIPLEILCHIFSKTVTVNIDATYIAVSHVCRFWRDVTLKNPPSGAYIPLWNPDWVQAMLERHEQAPVMSVSVQRIPKAGGPVTQSLELLFPASDDTLANASRLRRLELECHPSEIQLRRIVDALVSSQAPHLESFSLEAPDGEVPNPRRKPRQYFLPLPAGFAPRLHTLRLRSYAMSWDSPIFQTARITHLSLHDLHHDHRPSVEELRTLLQAIPHVQTLSFRKALSRVHDDLVDFDIQTSVYLSHLRSLDVSALSSSCMQLFNLVRFPSNIDLTVNIRSDPSTLPLALSSFAPRIDPLTEDVLFSVEDCTEDSSFSSIRLQSPPDDCAADAGARRIDVHVTSMGRAPVDVFLECIALGQASATHLRLREDTDDSAANDRITRTFMDVNTTTSLSTDAPLPLIARFRELSDTTSGPSTVLLAKCWPRMMHLHVQPSSCWRADKAEPLVDHWDAFVDVIATWAQARSSQRLQMPHLHITGFQDLISASDKGKLERVVEVVHWDNEPDESFEDVSDSDLAEEDFVDSDPSTGEEGSDAGFADDDEFITDEYDSDDSAVDSVHESSSESEEA